MVILNPLEPWPGELVLPAAERHGVKRDHPRRRLRRALPRRRARGPRVPASTTTAASGRRAGSRRAARSSSAMRPIAERHGLTMLQLACHWNLAHGPVHVVAPTLIEEPGSAKSIEDKRAELAAVGADRACSAPRRSRRSARSATTPARCCSRAPRPTSRASRCPTAGRSTPELTALAGRWGIEPGRDLTKAGLRRACPGSITWGKMIRLHAIGAAVFALGHARAADVRAAARERREQADALRHARPAAGRQPGRGRRDRPGARATAPTACRPRGAATRPTADNTANAATPAASRSSRSSTRTPRTARTASPAGATRSRPTSRSSSAS